MKVTNISQGPRGLHSADGALVMIDPGHSETVTLEKSELTDARATGWFSFGNDTVLDHDGDGEPGGVADPTPLTPDEKAAAIDQLDDDGLRDFIFTRTGKKAHHKAGREKLLELAKAAA